MDSTVHTDLKKVKSLIRDQGSKFICLTDHEGNRIVPFNAIGKPWEDRFVQAERKLKALPDGIYVFQLQDNFGSGMYSTKLFYQKGTANPEQMTIHKNGSAGSESPSFSPDSVLQNAKEASKALAENEFLKRENEALKLKLAEHESQIKALKEANEELENLEEDEEPLAGIAGFLKDTVPHLLPAVDRYFDLKEKQMNLDQVKFLHEAGYEVPNMPKKRPAPSSKAKKLPEVNGEGWEDFVNYFMNLPDSEFEGRMKWLQQNAPAHYEALVPLVMEDSDESEEQNDQSPEDASEENES